MLTVIKERVRIPLNSLKDRFSEEREFNTFHRGIEDLASWEREKKERWIKSLSNIDRSNIEAILIALEQTYKSHKDYDISLVAIGSSTYKKDYSSIDLLLNPTNGKREMIQEFFNTISNELVYDNLGEKLTPFKDWQVCFWMYGLYTCPPNSSQESYIYLGIRGNIFTEGYKPLTGQELLGELRKNKKPYVALIIDNQRI